MKEPANNMSIFFLQKIGFTDHTWVCLSIESACAPSTNDFVKKVFARERVVYTLDKESCIKELIFFDLLYVNCIYFTN